MVSEENDRALVGGGRKEGCVFLKLESLICSGAVIQVSSRLKKKCLLGGGKSGSFVLASRGVLSIMV